MRQRQLDAVDAAGDSRSRGQSAQNRHGDRFRVGQHQKVGELGLTDRHLGHRAPVGQFVLAE
ncbi:Uncharacterised protein [Mycobacterium tuberculosis]|uniref:Uncharacterized protein n=1 Tax=Mycobacterium tuberculosis TaxID=1773 RepID=A0A655APJ9_MYCTX|nr:Uncharacterised protein [Mycobacterium tuberculosis]CFE38851.1 Uncharacterised protein [Mycobacterium tuberculosis]CFE60102.1 Uncharacterised protein [Mycobacterium tuberculosis]CKT06817.1 Uncharacterised protein [Mycobacterium tuberculosis]CKT68719.1 Uncharacterised protein [Mycobacterium tuberculosis]